ncbi:long-chain fatty acid transport protein [Vibrio xiamenensis]|uniref:Long-chain fatty acid transport protein n=1 Tax=Vibrio xiamenensis TaxID=861298 RepID=A0A1G7WSM3_9VIBR|nr:outer membrane protein transport protein [Vibrio xiamenensis]SDG74908.1 long-chain fatty acid transport protein [Vibrio xiamenensis]
MNKLLKATLSGSVLLCSSAHAAGLYLYELANTDVGFASAGNAARAQDASVLATNPAGLSHIQGRSFTGGLQGLYGDATYEMDSGADGGNVVGFVPMASAFYSQQMDENLTVGIGLYGNYGMGLEFDNFPLSEGKTQSVILQPSASYRLNEHWSLGAGLGIHYGTFEAKGDLLSSDVDDTDVAINGKFGVLYEPSDRTRFGLAYTSKAEFDFKLKGNVAPMNLDFSLNSTAVSPQQIAMSAFHQVNDRFAIMGNLNWQNWEDYSSNDKFRDTYQVAFGTQYQLNPTVKWNAGIAYDTSMFKHQYNGDLTIPTGGAVRVGTGFDYALSEGRSVGVAFTGVFIDSSSVSDMGAYNGHYHNPALYFLNVTYSWAEK